ncbi:hypothetical protein C8F04DRAFT_1306493 [Mycena alexandri]|uniref:Mitochondrial splicing suppressor 51-like C-terminal domain-containing protein n=1 Tax=Mycena alexandri TaxID=1745969 RepID=A0AAD6SAA9_9AGAR|nr:hypothetical protein C8F04DRAFT_1306493 [Mycena alexandri]
MLLRLELVETVEVLIHVAIVHCAIYVFWAQLGLAHVPDLLCMCGTGGAAQPFTQSMDDPNLRGYTHGAMMLAEEWPSDIEGWKLQDEELVPHIFFTAQFPPPPRPRPGQVRDWKSWYEWRGLSLESPAAVLMDHVLTTYYLLTETLKVVDLQHSSNERQVVDVHYLGMETELNYLPLFSELALLLANTHLNLTVFSPATHSLLAYAEQRYPRPIAAREGPVWEYTAPRATGGGSIAISLYHTPPLPPIPQLRPFTGVWQRSVVMLAPKDHDALVALNAGILSYSTWHEVVLCATINLGGEFFQSGFEELPNLTASLVYLEVCLRETISFPMFVTFLSTTPFFIL